MSEEQLQAAFNLVASTCAKASMPLDQHQVVQQALGDIRQVLKEHAEKCKQSEAK